jgi:hypothetical protein
MSPLILLVFSVADVLLGRIDICLSLQNCVVTLDLMGFANVSSAWLSVAVIVLDLLAICRIQVALLR